METWMYGLLAIPVVALGAAYSMGAFSTNIPAIDAKIANTQAKLNEAKEFSGDTEYYQASAGRKRKTKKSKSKNKKTKRRKH